ncbi:hypothetical protein C8J57DRAFT_1216726 [Mycena rebaudengoi]|nr:hypothetical protein C8J57DRAFT_1216726 [Mycena rebaudengoi]
MASGPHSEAVHPLSLVALALALSQTHPGPTKGAADWRASEVPRKTLGRREVKFTSSVRRVGDRRARNVIFIVASRQFGFTEFELNVGVYARTYGCDRCPRFSIIFLAKRSLSFKYSTYNGAVHTLKI